jgi:hypothetical protein
MGGTLGLCGEGAAVGYKQMQEVIGVIQRTRGRVLPELRDVAEGLDLKFAALGARGGGERPRGGGGAAAGDDLAGFGEREGDEEEEEGAAGFDVPLPPGAARARGGRQARLSDRKPTQQQYHRGGRRNCGGGRGAGRGGGGGGNGKRLRGAGAGGSGGGGGDGGVGRKKGKAAHGGSGGGGAGAGAGGVGGFEGVGADGLPELLGLGAGKENEGAAAVGGQQHRRGDLVVTLKVPRQPAPEPAPRPDMGQLQGLMHLPRPRPPSQAPLPPREQRGILRLAPRGEGVPTGKVTLPMPLALAGAAGGEQAGGVGSGERNGEREMGAGENASLPSLSSTDVGELLWGLENDGMNMLDMVRENNGFPAQSARG